MDEATLGYELNNGERINMHVGMHDWNAQCAMVEDALHAYHLQSGKTDADVPGEAILNAAYCVRNMRDSLLKLDGKVDQLIDENMELAGKLETATNGINAIVEINKRLGEQNEELRQRLQQYEGSQNAPE